MPDASHVVQFIQDLKLILMALRELAGELVFTFAGFYGLYHAFMYLRELHRPRREPRTSETIDQAETIRRVSTV